MWKQLRDANWKVSYIGGWCLKYVQDAFGTNHLYGSAIEAWNANYGNGNHTDLPPVGKTVPVYFSLGNVPDGHVAISLDDGEIASSTQAGTHPEGYIHPSLNDLIAVYGKYNGGCHYLGWSEYVGTVHVLAYVNPNASVAQIKQDYLDILERPADASGLAHYQNYTNAFVRNDLLNSTEYHILQARKAAAAEAAKEAAAKSAAAAIAAKAAIKVDVVVPPTVVTPPIVEPAVTSAPPVTPVEPMITITSPAQPTTVTSQPVVQLNFFQWLFNLIAKIFKKGK